MRIVFFAVAFLMSGQVVAQGSTHPCRATDLARSMEILIGEWDAYSNGEITSRIKAEYKWGKCAIIVTETTSKGKVRDLPFFYYDRKAQTWRRIFSERRIKEMFLAQHSNKSFAFVTIAEDVNENPVYIRETYTKLADGSLNHVVEAAEDLSGPWFPKKEGLLRRVN